MRRDRSLLEEKSSQRGAVNSGIRIGARYSDLSTVLHQGSPASLGLLLLERIPSERPPVLEEPGCVVSPRSPAEWRYTTGRRHFPSSALRTRPLSASHRRGTKVH